MEKTNGSTDGTKAEVIGIKRPQGGNRRQYREKRPIGIKRPQKGEDQRQYRGKAEAQESTGQEWARIADNTESRGRGYRNQEATEGG